MSTVSIRLNARLLSWAFLPAVALDIVLIVGRAASFPGYFAQPNSAFYLLEPLALLLVYAGAALWLRRCTWARWWAWAAASSGLPTLCWRIWWTWANAPATVLGPAVA